MIYFFLPVSVHDHQNMSRWNGHVLLTRIRRISGQNPEEGALDVVLNVGYWQPTHDLLHSVCNLVKMSHCHGNFFLNVRFFFAPSEVEYNMDFGAKIQTFFLCCENETVIFVYCDCIGFWIEVENKRLNSESWKLISHEAPFLEDCSSNFYCQWIKALTMQYKSKSSKL